ncbi:MAG: hypothetical protein CM15mP74_32360 [Halieaceae bacterium]|nr:MAG: hypothetical protein CM15mP74_32360 [Halieaceae bacterium]
MIGEFQILQHYLADMAMWQTQGELLVMHTATLQASGAQTATESTMAKVLCSEYVSKAADLGIQILGGMGYSAETDMQRYWRDSKAAANRPYQQRNGPQQDRRRSGLTALVLRLEGGDMDSSRVAILEKFLELGRSAIWPRWRR